MVKSIQPIAQRAQDVTVRERVAQLYALVER
jgi:hypothetical protein